MPVKTRQQLKMEESENKKCIEKYTHQYEKQEQPSIQTKKNIMNHANIDFEDASREWRKNKIKHENCHFTYIDTSIRAKDNKRRTYK
jgi:uncharacterized protein (DUF342 family)